MHQCDSAYHLPTCPCPPRGHMRAHKRHTTCDHPTVLYGTGSPVGSCGRPGAEITDSEGRKEYAPCPLPASRQDVSQCGGAASRSTFKQQCVRREQLLNIVVRTPKSQLQSAWVRIPALAPDSSFLQMYTLVSSGEGTSACVPATHPGNLDAVPDC